jgi:hypothetical protein
MNIRTQTALVGAITLLGTVGLTGTGGAATAPSPRVVSSHARIAAVKMQRVIFKGHYSGTIAMLWSSNSVAVTAVTGTGTATRLGASTMSGTGSGSDTSTCDPFGGAGTLKGAGSVIRIKVVSSSSQQACAAGDSAPTSVTVKGVATVLGGTGKYAGATGNLTFTGGFSIQSSAAGSNESDAFTATLTGTLSVKG